MDPSYQGAEYMDPELRKHLNGHERNEYPHPQDIHDAIQREIEKERIREEIIMSEIVRRRVLEAEVRRELMMEREMALRQGSNWFPFGSSPVMGLESPMRPSLLVTKAEGWSAEERLGMALEDKDKLKRSENGGLETLPFQRGTADLRTSEVKPVSEGLKDKKRIILVPKPNENVSGSKTKDLTPPEVVDIELLADDVIANKISKEVWSCALCQVMATSEKDLNEHMRGKKHMSNVAALRAQRTGKNYTIGLFPKKATKPIHVKRGVKLKARSLFSQKVGKATSKKSLFSQEVGKATSKKYLFSQKARKATSKKSLFSQVGKASKKDDLLLSENPKSKHLKKTQAGVIRKIEKEDDPRIKVEKNEKVIDTHNLGNIELPADVIKNKKWSCALCQIIATSEKDLNVHVLEKKHMLKVAALRAQRTGKNHGIGLFPEKATKPIHVKKGVKLKAQSLFSQKAGKATSERSLFSQKAEKATSKKDDLPFSEIPKSKHLKKTQAEVIQKVQKKEDDPRKKVEKNEKVMNAHKLGNIELAPDVIKNKKWGCAICHVFSSSKYDQDNHVLGKKHKSKVAALEAQRTGKNQNIPKKAAMPINLGEEGVKLKAQSLFSEKPGKATLKKGDLPLLGNPKSKHLKKTQAEVIRKVNKNEDDPRKKVEKNENDSRKMGCKYSKVMNAHKLGNIGLPVDVTANKKSEWSCAICQVCASSEKALYEHVLGKKHKSKEAALRSSED